MRMQGAVAEMRDVATLMAELERMPAFLEGAARRLGESRATIPPAAGGFSLVEQAWHLADLESEGYAVRIRRLRAETQPALPDFEGDRIARERNYRAKSLAEGLAAFTAARRETLAMLCSLGEHEWDRDGSQQGVGRITLRDLPCMMAGHDAGHRKEIEALLPELNAPA
jgi:hypothetical protein